MSESLDLPILDLSDEFEKLRVLQSPSAAGGSFGSVLEVFKAKNASKTTEILFLAVKKYPETVPNLSKIYKKSLKNLSHKNLVRIFGQTTFSDGLSGLVIEVYETNLRSLLDTGPESGKSVVVHGIRNVMSQVLDGLLFLHAQKVALIHLKPENILLDSNSNRLTTVNSKVKISDYGYRPEALLNDIKAKSGPNLVYLAPELKETQSTPKVKVSTLADIFSCGIIAFEMILGRLPGATDKLSRIPDPLLQDFVRRMVKRDPSERIRTQNISTHAFLSKR